jgi:tetratricopeptide (TPR) repeat protein
MDPNTAWPPRPFPVDASSQPARLAAPDPSIRRSQQPGRHDAGGADRLKVALSHGRLLWLVGGIASASVAAILATLALPNPEALPPEASQAAETQPAQATGPRRGVRPEQPVDRAAADLRERVRLARDAAAAGVPMTPPAADPPVRHAPVTDPLAWIRSADPGSAASHRGGKKPARRLVVDYTARPNEPAPPSLIAQSEEDPAIGRARNAYTTGNQQLFVGDLDGAVRAYREALEIYPGYVGGYRGLGLAYQQLGDTADALAAFRTYVVAVPKARDIALIKKRISHLQRL